MVLRSAKTPHPYSSSRTPHHRSSRPPPILPLGKASTTVAYTTAYGYRPSTTRTPPHFSPPEDTSDCSLFHIYTHLFIYPPSPCSPARHPTQASTSASIPSHPSHRPCGSPDPDCPTRARSVDNLKLKVVAGSARPLHTRQRSERRSGRPGRPTTPRIPTDTRTGSVLPWPNNPLLHDGNPSMRTSADAASTT